MVLQRLTESFRTNEVHRFENVENPLRAIEFTGVGKRIRSAADISVTNSFYHYYALMTGRAVQQEKARVLYVDTTAHEGLNLLLALRKTGEGHG